MGSSHALESASSLADKPLLEEYTSVTAALQSLNSGEAKCADGICRVYSDMNSKYYVLWRSDMTDLVLNLLNLEPKKNTSDSPNDRDVQQAQELCKTKLWTYSATHDLESASSFAHI